MDGRVDGWKGGKWGKGEEKGLKKNEMKDGILFFFFLS